MVVGGRESKHLGGARNRNNAFGFDYQSEIGHDRLDSQRSLTSLQQFNDNISANTSVERSRRKKARPKKNKFEVEGLFLQSDSDEE